jgi:hypothetical protein
VLCTSRPQFFLFLRHEVNFVIVDVLHIMYLHSSSFRRCPRWRPHHIPAVCQLPDPRFYQVRRRLHCRHLRQLQGLHRCRRFTRLSPRDRRPCQRRRPRLLTSLPSHRRRLLRR